jgi:hypothetical protein
MLGGDHSRMRSECSAAIHLPLAHNRPGDAKESNVKTTEARGVVIATAAALLFGTLGASAVRADEAQIKCTGVNACKGQSSCMSARNSCKGMNSCKGKGFLAMSRSDCTAAQTKAKAQTQAPTKSG